jgi:hypothetical protein
MGRKKQDRRPFTVRVANNTPQKLKEIAALLGFEHGGGGKTGGLLDAIADGDIILLKK